MAGDGGILDGVSAYRAVVAAAMGLLVASFALFLDDAVTPTLAAIYVLLVGYFVATAFDWIREHPAFRLASTAWTAVMFVLLSLGPENSPFFLALAALTALGVLVEAYNYRRGTSYLRIDW